MTFYVVAGKPLPANTNHTFCVLVTNPTEATASACPDIRLSLSTEGMSRSYLMAQDVDRKLLGYSTGMACAGRVDQKRFLIASARATGGVTGGISSYIMEFMVNSDMKADTQITVSGLRGYTQPSGKLLLDVSRNGNYDSSEAISREADWSGSSLVLKVLKSVSRNNRRAVNVAVTSSSDLIEITFTLRNGNSIQGAGTLTVSAPGFQTTNMNSGQEIAGGVEDSLFQYQQNTGTDSDILIIVLVTSIGGGLLFLALGVYIYLKRCERLGIDPCGYTGHKKALEAQVPVYLPTAINISADLGHFSHVPSPNPSPQKVSELCSFAQR